VKQLIQLINFSILLIMFSCTACSPASTVSHPTGDEQSKIYSPANTGTDHIGDEQSNIYSPASTGSDPPGDDDWNWCSHTKEEKSWIHDIGSEFHLYVGTREFERLDAQMVQLTKNMTDEEMWEFTTLPQLFRSAELKLQEVIAVIDAINANDVNARHMDQGRISEQEKQKVLNELFGDDVKPADSVVNAVFPVEYGAGLLFGTEPISNMEALNATAENSLPFGVVGYVGVRHYNEWAASVTRKDYNIKNFLTTFEIPAEIFDRAIEAQISIRGKTIYTKEYYDRVRLAVYGETKALSVFN